MKHILLFGATGRTGGQVLKYALDKGYKVTALVRNPEKITEKSSELTVIKGLPTDIDNVRKAILNCDRVISTLNPINEKDLISLKKIQPPRILEKSTRNAIECMGEYKIKKIAVVSSVGIGDTYLLAPWFMRLLGKITNFRNSFDDHNVQESLLMNSNLDWVIARPVSLNNNESLQNLVINYDKKPSPFKISRKQLAKFLVDCLETEEFFRRALILSEKP
jgi:nucleoside-diphosphate-sugar epimerase